MTSPTPQPEAENPISAEILTKEFEWSNNKGKCYESWSPIPSAWIGRSLNSEFFCHTGWAFRNQSKSGISDREAPRQVSQAAQVQIIPADETCWEVSKQAFDTKPSCELYSTAAAREIARYREKTTAALRAELAQQKEFKMQFAEEASATFLKLKYTQAELGTTNERVKVLEEVLSLAGSALAEASSDYNDPRFTDRRQGGPRMATALQAVRNAQRLTTTEKK